MKKMPISEIPLVLSIQSHVVYGHVGNAAAALPLQLLGVQPLLVNTVQFSNHTGYGEFKGQVFSAEHIRDLLDGLRARGVLQRCSAVLSGYLGDAAIGEVILDTVQEIRRQQPDLLYLCDPVMGDVGRGLFVRPGIPEFLGRRALQQASLITPNQYEFELLHGRPVQSLDQAIGAARELLQAPGRPGPKAIVITSLRTPDLPQDLLGTLAVSTENAWLVQTPYLGLEPLPNGMGDVFSAILLGQLLAGRALPKALSLAVSALYGLVRQTPIGDRDLPLIAAQREIVQPTEQFVATPVA